MSVIGLIATSSYILVNKKLAKLIGFKEAAFFGELCGEHDYWENQDKLTEDGYFYSTLENIEKNTTFSPYQQKTILDKLEKIGLVETERRGDKGVRHIKINEEKLVNILNSNINFAAEQDSTIVNVSKKFGNLFPKNLETSFQEIKKPVSKFLGTNNNISKNNILEENNKIESSSLEETSMSLRNFSNNNSTSTNLENAFNKTLKKKQKEEKEFKKEIKNKVQMKEFQNKSDLEDFIKEKLSDVDNEESRKRKEMIITQIAEKRITEDQKKKLRIKNCRLEEAATKHFNNDIIKLLGDYIDMYHEKYDILPKQTWEYILGDLATINDNPSLIIECIKNSIVNAYRRIYVSKPSQDRPNSPDKRRGILTEEERIELENNLARNDDGSLMQF